MAQITARFVAGTGFVTKSIQWMTDFWASHVEWVLDSDWVPYLSDADKALYYSMPIGIQLTLGAHFNGGIKLRPSNYDKFERIEYVTLEVTDAQKSAIIKAAVAKIGTPYDVVDIAGITFHQNWSENGHSICSVFVTDSAYASGQGVRMLRVTNNLPNITPRDNYLCPLWKTVLLGVQND